MCQWISRSVKCDILRKGHRQIRLGDGNNFAGRAMNDRNRTAPISLPRNAPIAQAEIYFFFAYSQGFKTFSHFLFGSGNSHTIQEIGIDEQGIGTILIQISLVSDFE